MATRPKPHIDLGSITKRRDRLSFKNFVLEVIDDTFIFEVIPTSISLSGELFTLNLNGYRFVYEDLVVADSKDYLDVYLYGVKQADDKYSVAFDATSITITFTESITRVPADVVRTDFEVKGKIAEIL
jgi:hypothetical protein